MNSISVRSLIQMFMFGLLLALIKLVYLFFDPYNILDFIVFFTAGFLLAGKIPPNQRYTGLLLTLPAIAICLFFVSKNGYTSIMNGIGTSYAISLIVIPVATFLGIFLHTIRAKRLSKVKK